MRAILPLVTALSARSATAGAAGAGTATAARTTVTRATALFAGAALTARTLRASRFQCLHLVGGQYRSEFSLGILLQGCNGLLLLFGEVQFLHRKAWNQMEPAGATMSAFGSLALPATWLLICSTLWGLALLSRSTRLLTNLPIWRRTRRASAGTRAWAARGLCHQSCCGKGDRGTHQCADEPVFHDILLQCVHYGQKFRTDAGP